MRIATLLPILPKAPIGGFRVHYEYANRLAQRGHQVTVVHRVSSRAQRWRLLFAGIRSAIPWFTFHPNVTLRTSKELTLPTCDAALLTHWRTATAGRKSLRARLTIQIVYDYEFWRSGDTALRQEMAAAYRNPDICVATSRAVLQMLREAGREPDAVIPCGIETDIFFCDVRPERRELVVGIIARGELFKRTTDAVSALATLRGRRSFRTVALGWDRIDLPSWVERANASNDRELRGFFNSVAIFVLPSEYEGWGLPAIEAMACGAALVTTKNGGVDDFARDRVNCLLVPPRDIDALAGAVDSLLSDSDLRLRLSEAGIQTAKTFAWETSVESLEALLRRPG